MDRLSLADLDSADGQMVIRIITDRVCANNNEQRLADMHPEDAAYRMEDVKEVLRAFIEVSDALNEIPEVDKRVVAPDEYPLER